MTSRELSRELQRLTGIKDFRLRFRHAYHAERWAEYRPHTKTIIIYSRDCQGRPYDRDVLLREALHELAHHIQFNHVPFWQYNAREEHDAGFWDIYQQLMRLAFGNGAKAQLHYEG